MMIDTHSHLNFKAFDLDREKVIEESLKKDIWIINVGSDYSTSQKAVELRRRGVFASVGLHPLHVEDEVFDYDKYKELAKKAKAIGEIGLDYWYQPKDTFKQKNLLSQQIKLAQELNLPIIFHCRKAHDEIIEMLNNEKGVIHCFTGKYSQAKKYLEKGLYLGFNGIIFKYNVAETIKKMPLDRMLIETDCPYLTPPKAEKERNEPSNLKYIIEEIARIRGVSFEEIAEITTTSAKKLFAL